MSFKTAGRILLLTLGIIGIIILWSEKNPNQLLSPFVKRAKPATPFLKYSFPELRKQLYPGSEIKLGKVLPSVAVDKVRPCQSYIFTFETEGKKVSGVVNMPFDVAQGKPDNPSTSLRVNQQYPVIVMIRGYADVEGYTPGLGTRKPAEYFCQNGFITLAPDFLGFGSSDQASSDILEARFEKPITVMNLLASINNPTSHLPVNPDQVYLWGHSNGGQIVLSVLEISQANIPTVLWAPVTAGFPQSVLGYMGELDDQGLKVKNAIDNFLKIYDPKLFSIDNYWGDINTQIQLHQGLADPLVTEQESDKFVDILKSLGKDISIYKYPNNDHNLSKDWDKVVERDLEFFKKY